MPAAPLTRSLGRPRSFDKSKALDAAMRVFWRAGYQGASLSELTRAMGINRPSLYAAFGDKRSLFEQVLDRYESGPASYVSAALRQPTARRVIEALLRGTAMRATAAHNPRGCLFVQSALTSGVKADPVRIHLAHRRDAGLRALRLRLRRAKREGDLPPDCSPAGLARYVVTVIQGLAVQAAGGATRKQLHHVVRLALSVIPAG